MPSLEERIASIEAAISEIQSSATPIPNRLKPGVHMASNSRVHPTCALVASDGRDITIGEKTNVLRYGEWVGPISVGKMCFINRSSYIRANVSIGDNVNIGPFVQLVTDSHALGPRSRRAGANTFEPIRIGSGTWIGAGVIITGGVTVGDSCVIAAGSVVTQDVAPNTMVGGIPAKKIKDLP